MIVVLITAGGSWLLFKEKKNGSVKTAKPFEQKKAQVESTDNLENQYDLIVVGRSQCCCLSGPQRTEDIAY